MRISQNDWKNYISKLSKLSYASGALIEDWIEKNGLDDPKALVDYAYRVVQKYGNGSAALSAAMYDVIADLQGAIVPPAEMAPLPEYGEVSKTVYGTLKTSQNPSEMGGAVSRLVKRAGADTTLQNAQRDRAEFAWIPSGDTCAFCLTLASRGWQTVSKKALKNGHAEHIHSNCNCEYAIRFDKNSGVAGYDPDVYKAMYDSAEGKNSKDKINFLRRMTYQPSHTSTKVNATATSDVSKLLAKSNIKNKPVQDLLKPLGENEIIEKIAGGDLTKGSCSSLAYCYIGNKCGYDVTDFRGGDSQAFFAMVKNEALINKLNGIDNQSYIVKKEASDIAKKLKELNLPYGKEYRLSCGKHAAIIRNTENGYQYLELQSAVKNGWKSFEEKERLKPIGVINGKYQYEKITEKCSMSDTLNKRFGCKIGENKNPIMQNGKLLTDKDGRLILGSEMRLSSVDSYKGNSEFKNVLGYINTDANKQRKGDKGYAK